MANKPNRPKVPWESIYEIKPDYIAIYGGDVDVYIIYNKMSQTYHEEFIKSEGKIGTWYCYAFKDARRKAKSLYLKDQKTIEKALLK